MSLNLDKSGWKRVALGDVIRHVTDRVDPETSGIKRFLAGEHIPSNSLHIKEWGVVGRDPIGPMFYKRFRPGHVLYVSRRSYLRKTAVPEFEGITGEKTFVLETRDSSVLLQEFMPFLLSAEAFHSYAVANSRGSVNPYINWTDLANYQFDLPALDEQKRLADLLWAVERNRHALAVITDASAAAADAYFSSKIAFRQAESVPAPDLLKEMTVGVVVQPAQYYTDDAALGVPALRGLNVLPGGFDLTNLVYFRSGSAEELRKSTLRTGDVVVIRTGRPGDAAVVTEPLDGYNCIDLIILRPGPDIEPHFLARFLNSDFGRSQIVRRSAGTAQQHFNVGALKKLLIPALPLDDQRALVKKAEEIQAASNQCNHEHQSLARLRASLLTDIFGGVA